MWVILGMMAFLTGLLIIINALLYFVSKKVGFNIFDKIPVRKRGLAMLIFIPIGIYAFARELQLGTFNWHANWWVFPALFIMFVIIAAADGYFYRKTQSALKNITISH